MKIDCLKSNLKNVIIQAERFTGKNLTLPILNYILIEVKNKKCFIRATNLEMALESLLSCRVLKEGSVAIPSKILSAIIQNTHEENMTLEEKNNILNIYTKNSEISINGSSDKDFPLIPKIKQPRKFILSYLSLFFSLKNSLPSASRSDLKPEISGILLKGSGKRLKVVSTDTFRLAESEIEIKESDEHNFSLILPLRTAEEIIRIEQQEDTDVIVNHNDNQAVFYINDLVITSRLIDGVFPEYGGIIPNSFETTIVLDKEEFIKKIRSASVFSGKLNDISLKYSNNELVVEASNNEFGSASFNMPVKKFSGKTGLLKFNFRQILDGLEQMSGNDVFLNISGDNSPALIKSTQNNGFIYILMPIRNL